MQDFHSLMSRACHSCGTEIPSPRKETFSAHLQIHQAFQFILYSFEKSRNEVEKRELTHIPAEFTSRSIKTSRLDWEHFLRSWFTLHNCRAIMNKIMIIISLKECKNVLTSLSSHFSNWPCVKMKIRILLWWSTLFLTWEGSLRFLWTMNDQVTWNFYLHLKINKMFLISKIISSL